MNANDFTFGCEFELSVNRNKAARYGLNVGGYHHGTQVPFLPEGWTASHDGSLRTTPSRITCEIVSPILRGEAGIRQVYEVLKDLNAKGFKVAIGAGTHVHVGFANQPESQIRRLIQIVAYLETAIYATTGTKSRQRNHYCKGLRRHQTAAQASRVMKRDRYYILNISNLEGRRLPTIEFRAFSGSLNPVKILGWIQMCLGIVERGLTTKRLPRWTATPALGGWKKGGVGATDVERVFGFLGWGRGYARLKGGHMYGWLSDQIPQDEIKKEFRRLARKFDAEP